MSEANSSVGRARVLGTIFLVVGIVGLNSICTQFVAGRLQYHPALGEPLLGSIYQPFKWWSWLFSFYEGAPHTYNYAFVIFAVGVLVVLLSYVFYVGFATRSTRKHEGVHGTARFATLDDVQGTGFLPVGRKGGQGVYCGGFDDPKTGRIHYLRHDGPEHVCALAPTRSGKGVGLVIPTLLSWPHSVFVQCPSSEHLAQIAA